jgi:hypothetical protein
VCLPGQNSEHPWMIDGHSVYSSPDGDSVVCDGIQDQLVHSHPSDHPTTATAVVDEKESSTAYETRMGSHRD